MLSDRRFSKPGSSSLNRWGLASILTCLVLGLSAAGVSAQTSGAKTAAPVWTEKPVKVDQTKQAYERVAPAPMPETSSTAKADYPIHFPARTFYRILDSVSFSQSGQSYRLAGLAPVERGRVCKTADGQRWACDAQARAALGGLLTGRPLRCAERGRDADFIFLECQRSNKDVGAALVLAGMATGATGAERYTTELAKASTDKIGLWSDVSDPK